ncbi:MAG: hypothetical protein EA402_11530 [Planctomycetota bacterium]|nr:MAG: hypothetical protein EA402_11530 [Planctomycetota bacterium]
MKICVLVAIALAALLISSGCGKDPEAEARNHAHREQRASIAQAAIAQLDQAAADPTAEHLAPLFRLTDMTIHAAYGTGEYTFAYGPSHPITIAAMANLLLNRSRAQSLEAALSALEAGYSQGALDAEGVVMLRWLLDEISNLPRVMLSVPVAVPREGAEPSTVGYIEARSGFMPGQRVIADGEGLSRLLPYLRERLVR